MERLSNCGILNLWKYVHCIIITVVITQASYTDSASILVHPYAYGTNSRQMNMEKLTALLVTEGHQVTVIVHSRYDAKYLPTSVTLFNYSAPENVTLLNDPAFVKNKLRTSPLMIVSLFMELQTRFCEALLGDSIVDGVWAKGTYDLFLFDVLDGCAWLVATVVGAPSIGYSNDGFNTFPGMFYPLPLAYVPTPYARIGENMKFMDRVKNVFHYVLAAYIVPTYVTFPSFRPLMLEHNIQLELNFWTNPADLIFVNSQWPFDYARPTMPHVVLIGGIHFRQSNHLDRNLEDYMWSAGQHGVVVVSFGTLLATMEKYKAEIFARVFAKLQQKVIWRYTGDPPDELGNNTRLVSWLPQNDLLGHSATKLFITHCGVSSSHEAIQHAVPVVAMPISFDQFDHAYKLVHKCKVGVQISYERGFSEDALEAAINGVLENYEFYKSNAVKLSKLMLDQPKTPKSIFLYWIKYIIRHRGAKHLSLPHVKQLAWYQYFLLDVIFFLITILLLTVWTAVFICRCMWSCFRNFSQRWKCKPKVE